MGPLRALCECAVCLTLLGLALAAGYGGVMSVAGKAMVVAQAD